MMGLRTSEVLERVVRDMDDGARYLWIDAGITANARRHLQVPEIMQSYLLRLTQEKREDVLVVDEASCLTYGQDDANVLYHLVNDRRLRRRAILFSTSKPLQSWGQVLHDEDLAAALIDRILERGRRIYLDSPSLRTKRLGAPE